MRGLVLALLFAATAASGGKIAAADPSSKAMGILEKAIAGEKDSKVLTQALADLDALLAKNPRDADAHYARGWVLSRTNRTDDAVAAYDRAFELDGKLVDAAYNAGVVLGRAGNSKDALVRFERALKAYPKHVDAAFNAGQSYYDLGDYASAAARWETAAKLSPDDFQIAKKLVQAYVALGKPDKVKHARDRVFEMWKAGKPDVAGLKSYVYDQFTAGSHHVLVYEAFEPGDGAVYTAKVIAREKVIGSMTLERADGKYTVGVDKNGTHSTLSDHTWKTAPDYKTWKSIAAKAIEAQF